ncbi:hypothetical protein [Pseudoalteromonas sp. PS5]|uniref:hypothetical protein n=1 Tax=Pseudoalteromonas sp. PS5 TaxID=1437473 RepID=UPI000FFF031F|nr:hypothetical protein [Pseudoalteromonas sp. PS5]RXF06570.1 hypothetical protein D9603_01755 [Pseudoalteromonas sp. PS5]
MSLVLSVISFRSSASNAISLHQLNDSVYFIQGKNQPLIPNQALVVGQRCALLASIHGDLVATEALISILKSRFSVPLCYAVSLHSDIKQDTSIALLQHAFPKLVWLSPTKTSSDKLQQAFAAQLALFEQSIDLSKTRVSTLDKDQQGAWQEKLTIAKQRVASWSERITHFRSSETLDTHITSLNLGEVEVNIANFTGFTGSDLTIYLPHSQGLIGGYNVDLVPLVHRKHWQQWQQALQTLRSRPLSWVLPATGKPYKPNMLSIPDKFFTLLNQTKEQQVIEKITTLYSNKQQQQRAISQWQHIQQQTDFE